MKFTKKVEEAVKVGGGATGVSSVPDPVGGKATLPASKDGSEGMKKIVDPNSPGQEETDDENNTKATGDMSAKNRASVAMKSKTPAMKEEVSQIFAGAEISEEILDKTVAVFEAAVGARVAVISEDLEEAYQVALSEQVEEMHEELAEQLEKYLDAFGKEWLEENKIAIESAQRAEVAESFFAALKNLFAENYVEVPEGKADLYVQVSEELQTTKTKLDEALNASVELQKTVSELKRAGLVKEFSEGLTLTQVEKFGKLAESIEFDGEDSFKNKLTLVKETYFPANKPVASSAASTGSVVAEEVVSESAKPAVTASVSPMMSNIVAALDRTAVKK